MTTALARDRYAVPADRTPDPEDAAMVEGLRSGDRETAEMAVHRLYPRMYAACWRILQNEHDAREAVQDAFVSALTHIDQFRATARLSTWLLRISVNAALMKRRARTRHRAVAIESLLPRFTDDGHRIIAGGATPALSDDRDDDDAEDRRDAVRGLMDRLPDTHRTVLLLRDVEGLSTSETAAALDIRPGAVKVRLHRARMALRQLIEDERPDLLEAS